VDVDADGGLVRRGRVRAGLVPHQDAREVATCDRRRRAVSTWRVDVEGKQCSMVITTERRAQAMGGQYVLERSIITVLPAPGARGAAVGSHTAAFSTPATLSCSLLL
jgi:hypothetical protein